MIEELRAGIFRIQVPLPRNPLRALNAYLIRGKDRSLLVDNGFNRPECHDALIAGLKELGVDFDRLDYFLTHVHADHTGLTAHLTDKAGKNTRPSVICSAMDGDMVNNLVPGTTLWPDHLRSMIPHGFTENQVKSMLMGHPAIRYCPHHAVEIAPIAEGHGLAYGNYTFEIIDVRGHTPGHLALYEPGQKFLIAGDHILGDISPNITRWLGAPDSLGDYLKSLEKVRDMDIVLTLPGHRSLVWNTTARIDALFRHHRQRLSEIVDILSKGSPMQTAQIASLMTWDLVFDYWEDLPMPQQWFACGEALAHLDHLVALGDVRQEEIGDRIYFSMATIRG